MATVHHEVMRYTASCAGLAIDIRKEKLAIKTMKHRQLQSNY